jgi:hypothetical protein
MEALSIVAKLLAVAGSIFAVYKTMSELGPRRRARLREDFSFLENFLKMVSGNPPPHNVLIEKGYLAFSGRQLAAREILFLLDFDYPSQALKNYAIGREFVEVSFSGPTKIEYRGKYQKERVRTWYKRRQACWYFLFAILAISPLFFIANLIAGMGSGALIVVAAFFLAFGTLAINSLFDWGRMIGAECLMNGEFGEVNANEVNVPAATQVGATNG